MTLRAALSALGSILLAAGGATALWAFHEWREPAHAKAAFEIRREPDPPGRRTIRVGYFPNITHAQALLGLADGTFARAQGPTVEIQSFAFSAGPEAIEAVFGGSVDLVYVGPNPAINAHLRSKGGAVRIVAGAASGGAALVVHSDAKIAGPADLRGKRIATPQYGNTQDVAARHWLTAQGLGVDRDVEVIPMKGADQLSLIRRGDLQGAWTVEPWVSRIVAEAGGRVLFDERTLWPGGRFASAVILVNARFLRENADLVKGWLRAHVEITRRIAARPDESREALNRELKRVGGKALPPATLAEACSRIAFTWDPLAGTLNENARRAFEQGFLGREKPDLSALPDLRLLNEVLREAGLEPVK